MCLACGRWRGLCPSYSLVKPRPRSSAQNPSSAQHPVPCEIKLAAKISFAAFSSITFAMLDGGFRRDMRELPISHSWCSFEAGCEGARHLGRVRKAQLGRRISGAFGGLWMPTVLAELRQPGFAFVVYIVLPESEQWGSLWLL